MFVYIVTLNLKYEEVKDLFLYFIFLKIKNC